MIPALLIYYFVRVDIKMYNHIKGPFHYKVSQVSDVITELSRVKSWRWGPFYRDRIQAELKPGSIRSSQLKKVNNTEAYFLQIVSPHFYIQVPGPDLDEWFKAEHGFNLKSISTNAARCLIRNLAQKFPNLKRNFIEKQDIVERLEAARAADGPRFNAAAVRDCDLVVGHAFRGATKFEETFQSYDVILHMAEDYFSVPTFLIWCVIVVVAFYFFLMWVVSHLKEIKLGSSLCGQLERLELEGSPGEQLEQLDELISDTLALDKFRSSLALVEIQARSFVIIFNLNKKEKLTRAGQALPVLICPVAAIDEIHTQNGINCNGVWIPWPRSIKPDDQVVLWLHSRIGNRDVSDYYRKR